MAGADHEVSSPRRAPRTHEWAGSSQEVAEALGAGNRQAADVVTGDEVEVDVEFDPEPRVVAEPADFARALDADPLARAAYNRLAYGLKLQHVRAILGRGDGVDPRDGPLPLRWP